MQLDVKVKKKYVKKTEQYLKHYKLLVKSIEYNRHKRNKLIAKAGPKGLISANLDITGIKGTKGQEETVNVINELMELNKIIEDTENEIGEIEKVFDLISEENGCELYKDILVKWYKDGLPKEIIAAQLGISVRHIYELKSDAINKIAIVIYGAEALQN